MTSKEKDNITRYFNELFPDFICMMCKNKTFKCEDEYKIEQKSKHEDGTQWHMPFFVFYCTECGWIINHSTALFKNYYQENRKSLIAKVVNYFKEI